MQDKKETIDRIELPLDVERIIEKLRERVKALIETGSGGSILAGENLKTIGEEIGALANFAIEGKIRISPAIEAMRELLQEIISAQTSDQGNIIKLTDEQASMIGRYVDSIGPEPSGSKIVNNTQEKREIRVDLREKGIVTIIVHLNGPTVLAWKLNREKTEEEKRRLAGWLDRFLDQRPGPITLGGNETADFLRTFKLERPGDSDYKHVIATPRTFMNIILSDGRKISISFSANRDYNEYVATLSTEKRTETDDTRK